MRHKAPELFVADATADLGALTASVLEGLERIEWEMERIRLRLHDENVKPGDREAFTRPFGKITRECELLRKWLRAAPFEEPRN